MAWQCISQPSKVFTALIFSRTSTMLASRETSLESICLDILFKDWVSSFPCSPPPALWNTIWLFVLTCRGMNLKRYTTYNMEQIQGPNNVMHYIQRSHWNLVHFFFLLATSSSMVFDTKVHNLPDYTVLQSRRQSSSTTSRSDVLFDTLANVIICSNTWCI